MCIPHPSLYPVTISNSYFSIAGTNHDHKPYRRKFIWRFRGKAVDRGRVEARQLEPLTESSHPGPQEGSRKIIRNSISHQALQALLRWPSSSNTATPPKLLQTVLPILDQIFKFMPETIGTPHANCHTARIIRTRGRKS